MARVSRGFGAHSHFVSYGVLCDDTVALLCGKGQPGELEGATSGINKVRYFGVSQGWEHGNSYFLLHYVSIACSALCGEDKDIGGAWGEICDSEVFLPICEVHCGA